MNSASEMTRRLLQVAPVAAALVSHALAFDAVMYLVPVGLVLGATIVFPVSARLTRVRLLVVCLVGLVAGFGILTLGAPPPGPLLPAVSSILTGVLIGAAVFFTIAGRTTFAWTAAWVLVALSGNTEMSTAQSVALIAMLTSQVLAAATLARTLRAGLPSVVTLSFFALLVAGASTGIVTASKQLDTTLERTLQRWFTADGMSATTGLGEYIFVSAFSSIELSQRPLLELSEEPKRLRAHVLERFNGGRWSSLASSRSVQSTFLDIPVRPQFARELEMVLRDDLDDILPSPAGTWAARGAVARIEHGWVIRGRPENGIVVFEGDRQERLSPEPAPGAELLSVPADLQAGLGPLAEQLTLAGETHRAKAERVERFFQQNFAYTLDTNLVGQEHPLVVLVMERRPAYCVYFASAMAVMLRTQGIPTRIVSGFVPGEVNPITGRVIIRERDAHAWVEVWSPEDQRFIAFDPTPSTSREQVIGTGEPPSMVSACVDAVASAVRRRWLRYQRDPARLLSDAAKSPVTWIVLSALAALLLKRRWTDAASAAAAPVLEASDPDLRRSYRRYVRALRRAGVAPRPSETDHELIDRLTAAGRPQLAARATEFITAYRRARYRGDVPDERLGELARLE